MIEAYSVKMLDGDYLVHHGIKGQQWGVKNGPPYPLDKISTKGLKARYKYATQAVAEQRDGKGTHIKKAALSSGIAGAAMNFGMNKAFGSSTGEALASAAAGGVGSAIGGAAGAAIGAKLFAKYNDTYISNIERELHRRGESVINNNRSRKI